MINYVVFKFFSHSYFTRTRELFRCRKVRPRTVLFLLLWNHVWNMYRTENWFYKINLEFVFCYNLDFLMKNCWWFRNLTLKFPRTFVINRLSIIINYLVRIWIWMMKLFLEIHKYFPDLSSQSQKSAHKKLSDILIFNGIFSNDQ